MSLRFYFDEHVPRAVATGLRLRGIDVITAQEDQASGRSDSELLDRATQLRRIVFTQDSDFLREAVVRSRAATAFPGIVYAHPLHITIGRMIADLELLGKEADPHEMANHVEHLPL